MPSAHLARVHAAAVPDLLTFDVWVLTQLTDEIAGSSKIPASSLANPRCGSTSETGDCARVTLVLYRKRTARRFRLAWISGVRFRYSRQKESARGCGGRGCRSGADTNHWSIGLALRRRNLA